MSDTPNYYATIIMAATPLGWIGAHHFYVGNKLRGIIYIPLLFTLLSPLMSLIDSFILIYRGKESFIEKHGDEQDLEQYHLQELYNHNPLLAQQIQEKRNNQELSDIDKEDVPNSATEFMEEQREMIENEEEKEDEKIELDTDYSDYYGDWD